MTQHILSHQPITIQILVITILLLFVFFILYACYTCFKLLNRENPIFGVILATLFLITFFPPTPGLVDTPTQLQPKPHYNDVVDTDRYPHELQSQIEDFHIMNHNVPINDTLYVYIELKNTRNHTVNESLKFYVFQEKHGIVREQHTRRFSIPPSSTETKIFELEPVLDEGGHYRLILVDNQYSLDFDVVEKPEIGGTE